MSELRARLQEHIPALRRYARALVGDAAQADDLVQDCLERAVSRAHQWRQTGSLRGWLFTIMHNINANQRRSAARAPGWDPIERAENTARLLDAGLRMALTRDLVTAEQEWRSVIHAAGQSRAYEVADQFDAERAIGAVRIVGRR